MIRTSTRRILATGLAAVSLSAAVSACSSAGPGAANGPFMVWDPYPQFDSTSAWAQVLTKCANVYGASIERSSYAADALVAKAVAAQSQGQAPDILIVAGKDVPTLVADKLLAPASVTHLVGGNAYGLPIGGETITIPVQMGTYRYAIDDKIVACLQGLVTPRATH